MAENQKKQENKPPLKFTPCIHLHIIIVSGIYCKYLLGNCMESNIKQVHNPYHVCKLQTLLVDKIEFYLGFVFFLFLIFGHLRA